MASCGELRERPKQSFRRFGIENVSSTWFENVSIKIRLFIPMYKSIMSVLGH